MRFSVVLFALSQAVASLAATPAPEGCKKLSTDSDWPVLAEWTAAMPDVEVYNQTVGFKHTDYLLRAESYKDVQRAVQFCSKHNIRLVIITSGYIKSYVFLQQARDLTSYV